MGTDLIVPERRELAVPVQARLAGYAGLAGVFRGRSRRIAAIAGIDVLAVALAFGALHVTGAMVDGMKPAPFVAPLDPPADVVASAAPAKVVTPPRLALAPAAVVPAVPDPEVLFGAPVAPVAFSTIILTDNGPSTFTTSPSDPAPPPPVATNDPGEPPVDGTPQAAPPVAKIASIAMRGRELALAAIDHVATPAIDVPDLSLDRLLLRDPPAASAGTKVGSGSQGAGIASNATVQLASTAQAITTPVTQTIAPVAQAAGSVVGTVVGLLN